MKYENYKLEDGYFMNHGEDWTKEEMDDVLSTFPETKDDERKVEALKQLIEDIDNGVIKQTKWHNFHPSSVKAYANSHKPIFGYRNESYYKSAGMYIMYCGEEEVINSKWRAECLITDFGDDVKKINWLSRKYSQKEKVVKQNKEQEEYETIHAERIDQGKRTKEKMYNTELCVCTELDKNRWRDYYTPNTKKLVGRFYIDSNRYGEITTAKDELLTVEAGRELEKACDELAKEISEIIDVYNGRFTDIIRKGKETKAE